MKVINLTDAMDDKQKEKLANEKLRKQLPKDYPVPTIDGLPNDDEYEYQLPYDCVLVVPYEKYTESAARAQLKKQAAYRGVQNVGEQFYTARFWCQRARKSS